MKMVFRWFGEGNDTVPLDYIKQIPGVEGIVWALHDLPAGEVWPLEKILEVKQQTDDAGLHMDVVESVNIHEDIKLGLPSRDMYIDTFIQTIENLSQAGVKVICYNFMPVFDWVRTELSKKLEDGSTALFYEHHKVADLDPMELVKTISHNYEFTMPGWEPERLELLSDLFEQYKEVTEENLWRNLQYFLERVIPAAEKSEIKLAIHPDDPPFTVFGLPRIITNKTNLARVLRIVDSPANGLTLCSGSLGVRSDNDIAEMVRTFADRIPFAHVRNIKTYENGDFIETSHRTTDGSIDIYGIMHAFYETGFTGYLRPDHGRQVWNENCRPGYGLYDRAMGIMYLLGIWDSFVRSGKEAESYVATK
ncbi:mannonate dehydratase [Oceanobacillus profundus]|uniref:Mannonate dehydratase n=1 Tax=Oceanobacillus profundus TaxID=372463 RepID=A0A417YAG4_9BACI|nr:mannonate dehydratase [Oceanobacillus profundus]PAE28737.1 mannonate dehydratase [Paenibacillus sp. 7884-2]RHW29682.1 mannonate dehydratase [Oceanobacillus profundus]